MEVISHHEILFRDYLRIHPAIAREYEALKQSLLPKYKYDRDGYTEAKSEFVRKVIRLATHQPASTEKM